MPKDEDLEQDAPEEVVEETAEEEAPEAEDPEVEEAEPAKPAEKMISQSELDRILQKRLKRQEEQLRKQFADYDELKADAEQFRKLEDEKRTDAERWEKEKSSLIQERDAARSELTKLQRANLIADLASDAGLPKSFWKRVTGETEEEIADDIESMMNDLNLRKKDEEKQDGSKVETPKKKPSPKKVYGGGGEQEDPEPDIAKIVAGIPRGPKARLR